MSLSAADTDVPQTLVIACGALALEITVLIQQHQWQHLKVQCLPAELHNRPQQIPDRLARVLSETNGQYAQRFVAYADCGTGGQIDKVCQQYNVARLPGNHCYDFYAGASQVQSLLDEEVGTYFFTDFMVRHFEKIIWRSMGLDKMPELLPMYFSHYQRVVYLAQTEDKALIEKADEYAHWLALPLEVRQVGYGLLENNLKEIKININNII